jgi:adenylosuccinate synthase
LGDVSDTHKRQYEIVASEFGVVVERLRRLVELDLRRVEQTAEAQGVPWTSGRMPRWPPAGR